MPSELVEVEGHIIDSLILAKVLDVVLEAGADYRLVDVEIGKTNTDPSRARIEVTAADDAALASLLAELQVHGANRVSSTDVELVPCMVDGVLPAGFYATTNLPTQVRVDRRWLDVENPEMDCALVVLAGGRVRTGPLQNRRGSRVAHAACLSASARPSTSELQEPPNAKAVDSATSTRWSRATLGT